MKDFIKELQNELFCIYLQSIGCDHDCRKCNLVLEDAEIMAAYEAAIEALKTKSKAERYRTPQKVPGDTRIGRYGRCPLCGIVCDSQTNNFCPNCGQALDWSEVEE